MRSVNTILRDISRADVARGVYRVSLVASSHTAGCEAIIEMRGNQMIGYPSISQRGESAELALLGAEQSLLAMYGRCPNCGQHRNQDASQDKAVSPPAGSGA